MLYVSHFRKHSTQALLGLSGKTSLKGTLLMTLSRVLFLLFDSSLSTLGRNGSIQLPRVF